MVAKAVKKSRDEDDIPAVGVVDRDLFHRERKWEILFDVDEASFAKDARTDDVFTTGLWEVEAYLLCPELLSDWVGMQRHPPPASAGERQTALARTLEECEGLLSAVSFFCASHTVGAGCDIKHFNTVKHHEMPAASAAALAKGPPAKQEAAAEIDPLLAKVRAAAPVDPQDRLRFLLRYVDTKRLLARLEQRLKLRDGAHWALGVQMSRAGLRPLELEEFLIAAAVRFAA